jgi:hypothetical protein
MFGKARASDLGRIETQASAREAAPTGWGGLAGEEAVYHWPRLRPVRKPALDPRLARWGLFAGIVLLSLGLWAALIWAGVAIFTAIT